MRNLKKELYKPTREKYKAIKVIRGVLPSSVRFYWRGGAPRDDNKMFGFGLTSNLMSISHLELIMEIEDVLPRQKRKDL